MNYLCSSARFKFWNGKNEYTVEYAYGIAMWFVFNTNETNNCLYKKSDNKCNLEDINYWKAYNVLNEFLETITNKVNQ